MTFSTLEIVLQKTIDHCLCLILMMYKSERLYALKFKRNEGLGFFS